MGDWCSVFREPFDQLPICLNGVLGWQMWGKILNISIPADISIIAKFILDSRCH